MTEDILDEKVEDATDDTVSNEKETGSNQTKKQSFTQDEVTKIVAKEKAAWKRTAEKEKGSWLETEQSLREQLTARDEIIQKNVDILRKDLEISDDDWDFMAEGKDALQQYKYLLKRVEKSDKKDLIRTPKGEKKSKEFKSTFRANI